jgi:hypothetical protein
MKLCVSLPTPVSCYRVDKWRALWCRKRDFLLASNDRVVFALDFEKAACLQIDEINNLHPHQRAHWQRYLPHLADTEASQIVTSHQFTTLMRDSENNYWLYREAAKFALAPFSLQRRFTEPVLDAAFLQAGSVVALLFPGRILLSPCASWWANDIPLVSHEVAADFTHVLSDDVRSVVLYGTHIVAVYTALLQLVWQENYACAIQLTWLSTCGAFVFLLLVDNTIRVINRSDGKHIASTVEPLVLLDTHKVVPKNSIDGTATNFYLVSQVKGESNVELQQTMVYCITLSQEKSTDVEQPVGSPLLARQLIVKRPHVEKAKVKELTLADLN